MNQTSTIHSVDTGLFYAALKLSFPSSTKYSALILYAIRSGVTYRGARGRAAPWQAEGKNWAPLVDILYSLGCFFRFSGCFPFFS